MELLGINIPLSIPTILTGNVFFWILIIIIILISGIVLIFLMQRYKVYNKKIVVFENISGQGYRRAFTDRARLVKLGNGGEEILYLLKKKTYRAAYGKKMDANTYWFAIGQDGYWYNIILGDVDAKMGMLDIEPIDRDMRYMHVAIRKNIDKRYDKQGFMDKYGTYIMGGMFMLIMIIGSYFNVKQNAEIVSAIAGQVDTASKLAEMNQQVLSSIENVCRGTGLVKA